VVENDENVKSTEGVVKATKGYFLRHKMISYIDGRPRSGAAFSVPSLISKFRGAVGVSPSSAVGSVVTVRWDRTQRGNAFDFRAEKAPAHAGAPCGFP
jgi:hypothetical protein